MEDDNKSVVSPAENGQVVEDTTQKSPVKEDTQKEKMFSRDEVNKMLSAERNKIKDELFQEYESKKSEAEKLAKMDAEQKLNYELDLKTEENEALTSELNSLKLKTQANTYANEKGLPLGYIEDWDFAKETADSVKEKIDKLVKIRSADLDGYLKDKLKQPSPKAVDDSKKSSDPYIEGFKNYMKSSRK